MISNHPTKTLAYLGTVVFGKCAMFPTVCHIICTIAPPARWNIPNSPVLEHKRYCLELVFVKLYKQLEITTSTNENKT